MDLETINTLHCICCKLINFQNKQNSSYHTEWYSYQYLFLSAICQRRINKNHFAVARCDIYVKILDAVLTSIFMKLIIRATDICLNEFNNVEAGYQQGDLTLVSHNKIECLPSFVYLFKFSNYQIFYFRQISSKSQILKCFCRNLGEKSSYLDMLFCPNFVSIQISTKLPIFQFVYIHFHAIGNPSPQIVDNKIRIPCAAHHGR